VNCKITLAILASWSTPHWLLLDSLREDDGIDQMVVDCSVIGLVVELVDILGLAVSWGKWPLAR
jgi:hypothetical protein